VYDTAGGRLFEAPLTRFGYDLTASLELRVVPLGPQGAGAPIYFEVQPERDANGIAVGLTSAELVHTFNAVLTAMP
jgi:hypothetical protein